MSALEKLSIDTPEQVALEFPLAGIGSRFLAVAVDTMVQVAAIWVAILAAAIVGGFTGAAAASGKWLLGGLILFWFLLNTGYFAVFEALWNGQTPGKRLVGLRVIDTSGGPITVYAAILRNLLRVADELPGIYAIGILSILVTARQQRLGDLAAGTVVVHERVEWLTDLPRSKAPAVPLGARKLSAADVTLVEAFLHRRRSLDPVVRLETARQIARRMAASLQVEVGGDEERFLEQLAAEYRGGAYGVR
ncbi:MAG: RDD family protein [Vicinamibacterales bacterium]